MQESPLPPCSGIALGLDRLIALTLNKKLNLNPITSNKSIKTNPDISPVISPVISSVISFAKS